MEFDYFRITEKFFKKHNKWGKSIEKWTSILSLLKRPHRASPCPAMIEEENKNRKKGCGTKNNCSIKKLKESFKIITHISFHNNLLLPSKPLRPTGETSSVNFMTVRIVLNKPVANIQVVWKLKPNFEIFRSIPFPVRVVRSLIQPLYTVNT